MHADHKDCECNAQCQILVKPVGRARRDAFMARRPGVLDKNLALSFEVSLAVQ